MQSAGDAANEGNPPSPTGALAESTGPSLKSGDMALRDKRGLHCQPLDNIDQEQLACRRAGTTRQRCIRKITERAAPACEWSTLWCTAIGSVGAPEEHAVAQDRALSEAMAARASAAH